MLIDHRRILQLDDILLRFGTRLMIASDWQRLKFYGARFVRPGKARVGNPDHKITGKRIQAKYVIDPKLLGGASGEARQHDLRRIGAWSVAKAPEECKLVVSLPVIAKFRSQRNWGTWAKR